MTSTVARILKVNHGGEHGASRIYAAQIVAARWRCPELVPELADLLAHERRHEQMFLALMPARAARPCRLMPLWGVGGFALGLMTGLLGRTGVFVCTEAVERTVHRHLDHQLAWLAADPARADPALTEAIAAIQTEEEGHLAWAAARRPPQTPAARALYVAVAATVEALIWLSTQGESGRLAREMAGVGRVTTTS
jgi:3-demethoxyubiquinol 3-hydroxylase